MNKNQVTIIIPAKNEGEGLQKIIDSIKKYADEIILVDGHSTDNTKQIAEKNNVKYVLDKGIGRGDAVRIGIKKAKGDYLVFFDADGSHEANDIPKFIKLLKSNKADLVIGSRRTGGSFDLNLDFNGILRSGGADFLTYLVNKRFNTELSDVLYSFRAIKKSTAKKLKLKADKFDIEQEMVVSCLKNNYRLIEVPSREKKRAWGNSKLNTITGIELMLRLIKSLYF